MLIYQRVIIEQIIYICRAHMRVVKRRKTTHFPCRVICRVCTKQLTQKIAKILWMGQQNPKNQLRDVVYPWLFDFLPRWCWISQPPTVSSALSTKK